MPAAFHDRLRSPYALPGVLGVATLAVLSVDALHPALAVQAGLGAVAFAVLFVLTAGGDPATRRAVWSCVAVATLVELFGSIVWGVYRYRLHNVPLYVPPGHGLVYLMALRLSQSPAFLRGRRVIGAAVAVALVWTALGLFAEPLLVHRTDVFGAFWCVYFVVFTLRTSRGAFFAAVFVVTSLLEIAGTGLGDWTWQRTDPLFGIGSGNPPSVIAGGYCVIEACVILVTGVAARLASRHLRAARAVAVGDTA